MNRIELFRSGNAWMADFVGDAEVMASFGTTVVPTPFHKMVPNDKVKRAIEARNPGTEVVVVAR